MTDEQKALVEARIRECERLASIGELDKLPQYYTYKQEANFLKALLLLEKVK